jgi:CheY-like chemotaxis protein
MPATSSCGRITLSGYGQEQDVAQSREAGFATHLTKPVSLAALQAWIHEVTGSEGACVPAGLASR